MLICACVNGYSAHLRDPDIADLAYEVVRDRTSDFEFREWRATFFRRHKRQLKRFVGARQDAGNRLLLVGKSLGALSAVQAWNAFHGNLRYHKIGLVTVDPNWPLCVDWAPNLNNHVLLLGSAGALDVAINVYVIGTARQQCGAPLTGLGVSNRAVQDADHASIIYHRSVKAALCEAAKVVLQ